jgi:hypothetical protein
LRRTVLLLQRCTALDNESGQCPQLERAPVLPSPFLPPSMWTELPRKYGAMYVGLAWLHVYSWFCSTQRDGNQLEAWNSLSPSEADEMIASPCFQFLQDLTVPLQSTGTQTRPETGRGNKAPEYYTLTTTHKHNLHTCTRSIRQLVHHRSSTRCDEGFILIEGVKSRSSDHAATPVAHPQDMRNASIQTTEELTA